MPRIRLTEEHRIPVSIPTSPVCPRCLDIEPGVPGGDPNDPHPGPFADDLCSACWHAIADELKANGGHAILKTIAIRSKVYPLTTLEPEK